MHDPLPGMGIHSSAISTAPLNGPDFVTAVLASTAINFLWNQQQVVVVKASQAGLGFDPCSADTLFTAGTKYCDGQGNMYVLQLYNENIRNNDIGSVSVNAVPGFPNLGDYFLTSKAITVASERSQNRSGFQAPSPDASDLVNVLNDVDLNNVPLESVAAFNLPVCDMDGLPTYINSPINNTPESNSELTKICIDSYVCGDDPACLNACVFNYHLYCSCFGFKDKNGKEFPYGFQANACAPP